MLFFFVRCCLISCCLNKKTMKPTECLFYYNSTTRKDIEIRTWSSNTAVRGRDSYSISPGGHHCYYYFITNFQFQGVGLCYSNFIYMISYYLSYISYVELLLRYSTYLSGLVWQQLEDNQFEFNGCLTEI